MFRTPANVQLLGRLQGGTYRAVPTAEGPPDYLMLLPTSSGPVAVALEAKDCQGERWALKQLHAHQAGSLRRWTAAGGLGIVALRHAKSKTHWLLPWERLGPVWERWYAGSVAKRKAPQGSASLSLADLHVLGTPWEIGRNYRAAILSLTQVAPDQR